ncbi:hypothetical protein [Williamsia sp. CHRR-6]|uniref:DUF6924 domain-containing protein n=1 Tax=Williamsia sp. CHRR-6 TaxID=2835871 RepID=UPI001BDA1D00|nr:hypothetical protein [Williamsia sp. CHRR-6]MBT0568545.1 hypothetical protein [Williamsia sp. CHRR-6]
MPKPPLPDGSVLIRTDFSDDHAWQQLVIDAQAPQTSDEFTANFIAIDDKAWHGTTPESFVAEVGPPPPYYVFLADLVTFSDPEHPILAVDTGPLESGHEPGRTVRVIPSQMWSIENNLSLGNMDFCEFADHAGPDGVYRGFLRRVRHHVSPCTGLE